MFAVVARDPLGMCVHPARHAHGVEEGQVGDDGHRRVVERLRAVGPHVRTVRQVELGRDDTGARLVAFQQFVRTEKIDLAMALLEDAGTRPQHLRGLDQDLFHRRRIHQLLPLKNTTTSNHQHK